MADLKTAVFDWEAGEFATDLQGGVVTATGAAAVAQIVIKATQTIRGLFLIYADLDNPALNHKYGNDAPRTAVMQMPDAAKISELKRNIREALIYDPWIRDVTDVEIEKQLIKRQDGSQEWAYVGSAKIHHIYGTMQIEGVNVTNG
jgi:hypothetical protein